MAETRARVAAAQAEGARLETRTWSIVLIALGGAVGLALLATAFITRRMTRSLRLLSSATGDVAAGAFSEPILVESRDEIGALASSFNRMASQLRQTEEAKQEFFAIVSHELRSPLTSIRGAVDLLQQRAPDSLSGNQQRLTDIIAQSSERLLRLANQILEMSRLRAGFADLERKPLDLAALVDRVVEELHPQAAEAGIALECERYGSHFAYLGDEERLYQLVVNLLPTPSVSRRAVAASPSASSTRPPSSSYRSRTPAWAFRRRPSRASSIPIGRPIGIAAAPAWGWRS
jgi:signal transduction histidine kinase